VYQKVHASKMFLLSHTQRRRKIKTERERERMSERMSAMIEIKKKLLGGFNPI